MLHLHLLGLLTFEIFVLLIAFFFLAYAKKNELEKRIQTAAKGIIITMHIVIAASIIHAIIFHFMGCDHSDFMQQMHGGGMH